MSASSGAQSVGLHFLRRKCELIDELLHGTPSSFIVAEYLRSNALLRSFVDALEADDGDDDSTAASGNARASRRDVSVKYSSTSTLHSIVKEASGLLRTLDECGYLVRFVGNHRLRARLDQLFAQVVFLVSEYVWRHEGERLRAIVLAYLEQCKMTASELEQWTAVCEECERASGRARAGAQLCVGWAAFAGVLRRIRGAHEPLSEREASELRAVIDRAGTSVVTADRFRALLCGFGATLDAALVDRLLRTLRMPSFQGYMSSREAHIFLSLLLAESSARASSRQSTRCSPAVRGTYLVRFAATEPSDYAVAYVSGSEDDDDESLCSVVHSVVQSREPGDRGVSVTMADASDAHFDSITDAVDELASCGVLCTPLPFAVPRASYFVGDVTADEACTLLDGLGEGHFVVRLDDSEARHGPSLWASLHSGVKVTHRRIAYNVRDGVFEMEGRSFPSLDALVDGEPTLRRPFVRYADTLATRVKPSRSAPAKVSPPGKQPPALPAKKRSSTLLVAPAAASSNGGGSAGSIASALRMQQRGGGGGGAAKPKRAAKTAIALPPISSAALDVFKASFCSKPRPTGGGGPAVRFLGAVQVAAAPGAAAATVGDTKYLLLFTTALVHYRSRNEQSVHELSRVWLWASDARVCWRAAGTSPTGSDGRGGQYELEVVATADTRALAAAFAAATEAATMELPCCVQSGSYARRTLEAIDRGKRGASGSYAGEWLQGVADGRGVWVGGDGKYEGSFVKGRRHGHGSMTRWSGDSYTGEWADDAEHGRGVLVFRLDPVFERYEGGWRKGAQHGEGTFVFKAGQRMARLECSLAYGSLSTAAVVRMVFTDGRMYVGTFRQAGGVASGAVDDGGDGGGGGAGGAGGGGGNSSGGGGDNNARAAANAVRAGGAKMIPKTLKRAIKGGGGGGGDGGGDSERAARGGAVVADGSGRVAHGIVELPPKVVSPGGGRPFTGADAIERHGFGIDVVGGGRFYYGRWRAERREVFGYELSADEAEYVGEYRGDRIKGSGVMVLPGDQFAVQGTFSSGERHLAVEAVRMNAAKVLQLEEADDGLTYCSRTGDKWQTLFSWARQRKRPPGAVASDNALVQRVAEVVARASDSDSDNDVGAGVPADAGALARALGDAGPRTAVGHCMALFCDMFKRMYAPLVADDGSEQRAVVCVARSLRGTQRTAHEQLCRWALLDLIAFCECLQRTVKAAVRQAAPSCSPDEAFVAAGVEQAVLPRLHDVLLTLNVARMQHATAALRVTCEALRALSVAERFAVFGVPAVQWRVDGGSDAQHAFSKALSHVLRLHEARTTRAVVARLADACSSVELTLSARCKSFGADELIPVLCFVMCEALCATAGAVVPAQLTLVGELMDDWLASSQQACMFTHFQVAMTYLEHEQAPSGASEAEDRGRQRALEIVLDESAGLGAGEVARRLGDAGGDWHECVCAAMRERQQRVAVQEVVPASTTTTTPTTVATTPVAKMIEHSERRATRASTTRAPALGGAAARLRNATQRASLSSRLSSSPTTSSIAAPAPAQGATEVLKQPSESLLTHLKADDGDGGDDDSSWESESE